MGTLYYGNNLDILRRYLKDTYGSQPLPTKPPALVSTSTRRTNRNYRARNFAR
ncbi:MAG TPA: hypothetical protein VN887_03935 [Candidatus Angelobacter sp.]|nr:hypothetical protein [Candidatus Angelobacter sp.]